MKKILKKLKSYVGETIAEVLIALLISALGMLMLATMITSSSNSIMKSRKTLEAYYSASWENGTKKQVEVTFQSADGNTTYGKYELDVTPASKPLGGKIVLSYTNGDTT